MATYTSNYGWTKPSGSDNVDISVLNNNLDDQDNTIHDAFLNMAPPFSESSTYAVDDIVLYGTGLYKCHTAVVTPGSWTDSTNWQVYKLSEGGSGGGGGYVLPTATADRLGGVKIGSGISVEEDGTISASGGGVAKYADLPDKPSINGVTLIGNKTTSDLGINIPTNLADLQDDSSHRLVTDTEKATWNGKSDFSGNYSDLNGLPTLGTASSKNVPSTGDAGSGEVVMGNDSRLSDDRNAKDVYSWAKASTKPTYTATEVGAIPSMDKGANGGVAELDANGLVPVSQLPSYVDDVLEGTAQNVTETGAGTYSATGFILSGESSPCVPESGKTYVDTTSNIQYRWTGTGTNFVSMGSNLALGETSSTAYRGDRGKVAYDHSQTTGNPHGTTKSDVGLNNVPNVSTNNQTPTFSQASTRNNIASGEKLSVIFGKIQKFFNDLKTVAFTGSYSDLTDKPSEYPATQVMLSDGVTSVEEALDGLTEDTGWINLISGDDTAKYRKIGTIVYLHLTKSGLTVNTWSTIGTLPEGFRPSVSNLFFVGSDGSNNFCSIQVSISGSIQAKPSVSTYCYLDTSFIAEQ